MATRLTLSQPRFHRPVINMREAFVTWIQNHIANRWLNPEGKMTAKHHAIHSDWGLKKKTHSWWVWEFFLTKDGAIKAMNVTGCLKHTEPLYRLYNTIQPSLKPNQDADRNLARPLCSPVLLSRPQGGRVLEPKHPAAYDQRHDQYFRTHWGTFRCKYPYLYMDSSICVFKRVTCITNVHFLLQKDNRPFHRVLRKLKNCYKVSYSWTYPKTS